MNNIYYKTDRIEIEKIIKIQKQILMNVWHRGDVMN